MKKELLKQISDWCIDHVALRTYTGVGFAHFDDIENIFKIKLTVDDIDSIEDELNCDDRLLEPVWRLDGYFDINLGVDFCPYFYDEYDEFSDELPQLYPDSNGYKVYYKPSYSDTPLYIGTYGNDETVRAEMNFKSNGTYIKTELD